MKYQAVITKLNLSTHPFRNRNLPYLLALLLLVAAAISALMCFVQLRSNSQMNSLSAVHNRQMQEDIKQLNDKGAQVQQKLSPEQQALLISAHKLVANKTFGWSRLFADLESVLPGGVSASRIKVANVYSDGDKTKAELELSVLSRDYQTVVSMIDSRLAIVLLLVILGALGTALAFARRHSFAERWHVPALPSASVLLSCLACYAAFFAASAALLELLAYVLGFGVESFALLLAAGAASWAAGFIVIGAPGGLGVREAAFVALAGGALGESHALLLIGLFRIVTFLGDTLLFAAGALALRGADSAIGDSSRNHRSAP